MNYTTLQALTARDNRRAKLYRAAEYALGVAALAGGFASVYALAAIGCLLFGGGF